MAVSSTSFTKTPQAGDDTYDYTEDELQALGYSMDSDGVTVFSLDVMSNDLGGNAKKLWSFDGDAETWDALKSSDVVDAWQVTGDGNEIRITSEGKIEFKFTELSSEGRSLDSLGVNETFTDTFYYTIRLANGTLSKASVTVSISGSNDGPVAQVAVAAVQEDATYDGQVTATDVDFGETETLTFSLVDPDNKPEGLIFNDDGTYSFNANDYDYLPAGEKLDVVVQFIATDIHGTASAPKTLTITITGANDAAVITGTYSDSVTEKSGVLNGTDGDASASGDLNVSDVDSSADFVAQTNAVKSYGTFSIDATGAWSYTLDDDNTDVQALNTSSTPLHELVTVATADGTTKVIDVTINGANDAAVITGDTTADLTETNAVQSTGGTLTAVDVDNTNNVFQAQTNVAGDNSFGQFSIGTDGVWAYTMSSAHDEFVAGTDYTDSITVKSVDGTTQLLTVTIHGTAEVPLGPVAAPTVFTGTGDTNDFDALVGSDTTGGYVLVNGTSGDDTITPTSSPLKSDGTAQDKDIINGYGGNDTINAGDATDKVYGGDGNDIINGGDQVDSLYGQAGNDTIHGDAFGDTIYGGSENDFLYGDIGDDQIFGGSGIDTIAGGDGADIIVGGYGADTLTGGLGGDTFRFLNSFDTGDTINDFSHAEGDKIDFAALYSGTLGFTSGTTTLAAHSAISFYDADTSQTIVQVDTDGVVTTAELQIQLTGNISLAIGDFIL